VIDYMNVVDFTIRSWYCGSMARRWRSCDTSWRL